MTSKSTATNLLYRFDDWIKEVNAGNFVDVAYLEFSKALDSVPKRRLLYKLGYCGLQGYLRKWVGVFLSERTFKVKICNTYSTHQHVLSGVLYGSVLGLLLLVIYTADVTSQLCNVR